MILAKQRGLVQGQEKGNNLGVGRNGNYWEGNPGAIWEWKEIREQSGSGKKPWIVELIELILSFFRGRKMDEND